MDTRSRRVLLAAVVAVLALAAAAATIDSTVSPPGGGAHPPGPSPTTGDATASDAAPCVPWLATPLPALALVGGVALGTVLANRRFGRFGAVTFAVGVGLPTLGLYAAVTACVTEGLGRRPGERLGPIPVGTPADGGVFDPGIPPAVLGLAVLTGLALVGVLLVLARRGGRGDRPAGSDDDAGEAAARVAGAAADRLAAGGDVETEIHRAWREMAAHLDVARPATSTPGEFAEAAVAAGLPPDAVTELTALFEQVRYGGVEATTDLEARARAALARIEAGTVDERGAADG